MKKTTILALAVLLLIGLVANPALADKGGKYDGCTSIKDGVLTYSPGHYLDGEPLVVGYDIFGYNYQAHMFRGSYANAYLGRPGAAFPPYDGDDASYLADNPDAENHWTWPLRNVTLTMKWNDAWLSNKDCNGDGVLDRPDPYIGSGAWLTNHDIGINEDGKRWTYFVKIVAVPADASLSNGIWYTADGTEIGPVIWGSFAVIQQIVTGEPPESFVTIDMPFTGNYLSPAGPGLGKW